MIPCRQVRQGRPRLRRWRHLCMAQVVKRYAQRRVVDVERRLVDGTPARVETLRHRSHGDGVINTADIERLNATFRERLAALTRRGRALARRPLTLQHGMYRIGTVYNFCTPHATSWLRREGDDTGDGRRDHRSLLECARIVVVSRAIASVDATQAPGASLAGAQTSYGAVVWEPRLAVELPTESRVSPTAFLCRLRATKTLIRSAQRQQQGDENDEPGEESCTLAVRSGRVR